MSIYMLLSLFTTCIVLMSQHMKADGEKPRSIFMVYYKKLKVFTVYDVETYLKKYMIRTVRVSMPFSHLIILCFQQNSQNRKDLLFIESHHRASFSDVRNVRCKNEFYPDVIRNEIGNGYNSGYSVIANKKSLEKCGLHNFPSEGDEFEVFDDEEVSKDYPYSYFLLKQRENESTIFRIPAFWISWDKNTVSALQSIHRFGFYSCIKDITKTNEYTVCLPGYEIGIGHLKDIKNLKSNLEYYYDEENQNRILSNIIRSHEERFHITLLTPLDDFCDKYMKFAACTFLNTVPIWENIWRGPIKSLELYIQRIAKNLPMNSLEVRTIAYDILELPVEGQQQQRKIYLDPDHERIPVPRFFLKIIDYRLPIQTEALLQNTIENENLKDKNSTENLPNIIQNNILEKLSDGGEKILPTCNETKNVKTKENRESSTKNEKDAIQQIPSTGQETPLKYEHYSIAIIIHNEIPRGNRICGDDDPNLCETLNWKISSEINIRNAIYCCKLDDPKWKSTNISLRSVSKPLDLSKIPLPKLKPV